MVTSLISRGKDQGYILADDIIAAFPNIEEQVDRLDEFYSSLVAEGIEVLEQAPAAPPPIDEPVREHRADHPPVDRGLERQIAAEDLSSGVGDSVRLYLQEIGETDLLTMAEEVWLSKRMERGKLAEAHLAEIGLAAEMRVTYEADRLD